MVVSYLEACIRDNQWMLKSILGDLCQKAFPFFGQWILPLDFEETFAQF